MGKTAGGKNTLWCHISLSRRLGKQVLYQGNVWCRSPRSGMRSGARQRLSAGQAALEGQGEIEEGGEGIGGGEDGLLEWGAESAEVAGEREAAATPEGQSRQGIGGGVEPAAAGGNASGSDGFAAG